MNNQYTSKELFHFVGHCHPNDDEHNYEILKKILITGCASHYPHGNDWGSIGYRINWDQLLIKEELIVPSVTCYADIPLNSLGIHIKKYGRFGVSLPKNLLIKHGARPVIYIPMSHGDWDGIYGIGLLKDLEAIYKGYSEKVSSKLDESDGRSSRNFGIVPDTEPQAIKAMENAFVKDFLAYIKPFNSHLDDADPNNFYMEREWRKYGNMKFNAEDVCRVIVAEGFQSRLGSMFPCYSNRISPI